MTKTQTIYNMVTSFARSNFNIGRFTVATVFLLFFLAVEGTAGCYVSTCGNYEWNRQLLTYQQCLDDECSAGSSKVPVPKIDSNWSQIRYYTGVEFRLNPSGNCQISGPNVCEYCYRFYCTDECESDSVQCVNGSGGTWTSTGASTCGGKSCKLPVCKQSDTQWLNDSKAACDAIGGENNYAITEVGETCVHSGTCCPPDSIPAGNTCKWRCDSALTQCNGRVGSLFGDVLPDTSVSGQDTTYSYQCYYNCSHSPNPDSTVYLVEGNIVLSGPSDSIPDGIKSETFNSVRTTTGGVYIYDYLSPAASEYIDSIAAMKCVEHLWRCVINNKYVYWYDNQEVPAGCTNIVRVK